MPGGSDVSNPKEPVNVYASVHAYQRHVADQVSADIETLAVLADNACREPAHRPTIYDRIMAKARADDRTAKDAALALGYSPTTYEPLPGGPVPYERIRGADPHPWSERLAEIERLDDGRLVLLEVSECPAPDPVDPT